MGCKLLSKSKLPVTHPFFQTAHLCTSALEVGGKEESGEAEKFGDRQSKLHMVTGHPESTILNILKNSHTPIESDQPSHPERGKIDLTVKETNTQKGQGSNPRIDGHLIEESRLGPRSVRAITFAKDGMGEKSSLKEVGKK